MEPSYPLHLPPIASSIPSRNVIVHFTTPPLEQLTVRKRFLENSAWFRREIAQKAEQGFTTIINLSPIVLPNTIDKYMFTSYIDYLRTQELDIDTKAETRPDYGQVGYVYVAAHIFEDTVAKNAVVTALFEHYHFNTVSTRAYNVARAVPTPAHVRYIYEKIDPEGGYEDNGLKHLFVAAWASAPGQFLVEAWDHLPQVFLKHVVSYMGQWMKDPMSLHLLRFMRKYEFLEGREETKAETEYY